MHVTSSSLFSCVAAPLNPTYNASEVKFYLSDTKSALLLVPHGSLSSPNQVPPAVQAARQLQVPVAEIDFDGQRVHLTFESDSNKQGSSGNIRGSGSPQEQDVALVLHTSGTTGRPKGESDNFPRRQLAPPSSQLTRT